MDWCTISMDPVPLADRTGARWVYYELCLPLIPDGRVSIPMLQSAPEQAWVRRCRSSDRCETGRIELRDHQWICLWPGLTNMWTDQVRITFKSLTVGDLVGVRPQGGPIELFKVLARQPGPWQVS